ncbi:hypothetical protein DFH09DRAFT_1288250 [Mycena vulgaris]|nr:hypothetical protein DFH09DRAFT_1288250 [Mycena vulgaris]
MLGAPRLNERKEGTSRGKEQLRSKRRGRDIRVWGVARGDSRTRGVIVGYGFFDIPELASSELRGEIEEDYALGASEKSENGGRDKQDRSQGNYSKIAWPLRRFEIEKECIMLAVPVLHEGQKTTAAPDSDLQRGPQPGIAGRYTSPISADCGKQHRSRRRTRWLRLVRKIVKENIGRDFDRDGEDRRWRSLRSLGVVDRRFSRISASIRSNWVSNSERRRRSCLYAARSDSNSHRPAPATPTPAPRPKGPGLLKICLACLEVGTALATAAQISPDHSDPRHVGRRHAHILNSGATRHTTAPGVPAPARGAVGNDPPSQNTYTSAIKAQPNRAPRVQRASKPKAHAASSKWTLEKPRQRTASSTRLIGDLDGNRPTKAPHPDALCKAINSALDGRLAVSAVTTTRIGNLVLHASAPACSADTLSGRRTLIWETIRPLLGPWHKVVFHGVPMMEPGVLPSSRDFVREVAKRNQLPWTQYRIGSVRFLHARDNVPQMEMSVRVDFIEEADARRFLHDGIFLVESHCRASRYKPRATRHGRPSGGNSRQIRHIPLKGCRHNPPLI